MDAGVRKESDLGAHAELDNVRTLLLDVDDEDADLGFGDLALSQFGRLDALINNAGYFQGGPLEATTMDQAHRQFQTNVFGLIALNKTVIPIFRKQRSGVIVNVSSISADAGFPYTSVYQASKAAVASLSEGLHAELAEFGVQVKALHPGSHETKIFSKVDRAENVPQEYTASWNAFASLNLVRSDPALTAEVMFRMVTDGDTKKVHYYSGPDGEAIPRVKQLLGQDWYLEELTARNRGKATALWNALMPTPAKATNQGPPGRQDRETARGSPNGVRLRGCAHLAVAPDGQHVVVASHYGGEYAVLPVHEDGRLGPASHTVRNTGSGPHARQESNHPHAVVFDPRGRFLATADLGVDKVQVLWLADGRLEHVSEAPVPGIGVRGANLHPRPLRLSPPALHRRNRPAGR
ncbi:MULTISPECIES: SDR family NAD(P)-dependent oxidoreductase [unclassified Streptomyces]|uniref:SDR family NAD(P)-dependent oxidoreductase n=1 Tax=unclassified Streptomyces TaxID=2593676 RepID=UPI000FAA9CA8|nr:MULTISPECIES: SDR family NAD(P)-dependent oxidoreductase [unclassified Streptomyces]MCX4399644.1 SDR family NAD(P)-dependent oxidoreductase [Streptomyces sp. NBC_01767]RPK54285.1 Cyclopentanol dehydrogenase [Streptomyces sp. ADI95-17]